jgi:hypothetical protein
MPIKLNISEKVYGCAIPPNNILWNMENESYQDTPKQIVNDWKLISPYSNGIKCYLKGNDIVVAIRGTKDFRDVQADLQIVYSGIKNSSRYKEDLSILKEVQAKYPKEQYNYYCVAHSLGGVIANELIDAGLIKSGIAYNPAVDLLKFRNDTRLHRIYNESDILYNIMGRFTKDPEVRKNKSSIFSKISSLIPLGKLGNSIKAHLLSNFEGGRHVGFHIYLS